MKRHAVDLIYQQIKQKIVDGEYAPSQRLIETNLAQDLEVSRHKIRVALDRLHSDGLIEIEPNRGATVKSLELSEVLDILAAREALEGGVAYLAATEIGAAQLQQLTDYLTTMQEALDKQAYDQYSATNKQFHQVICEASGNHTMPQLIDLLRQRLARLHLRTILIPGRTEQSIQEHQVILAALQAGDATTAQQAARAHIRNLGAVIEKAWQLVRL